MIKRGTKYVITGVHERDAFAHRRKQLHGALIEAVNLKRIQKNNKNDYGPIGYWQGEAKFLTSIRGTDNTFKKNTTTSFFAVYLRRVKEEEA